MRNTMLTLLAAVALVATACGGGSTPLAVVNGQEITLDDLIELDPAYTEVGRFEQSELVDDLGLVVLLTAVETAAEDEFGVTVTEEEITGVLEAPPAELAAAVAGWEQAVVAGQITEGQVRANVRTFLIRQEVGDALLSEADALNDVWEQTPQVFASACVRHILTELEDEAVAAADRIAGGEDFAAVANEVSIDQSTDGGLLADPSTGECDVPLNIFVPEFAYEAATAPIGTLTGPFVSDFGWHIIIVEARTAPASLAEVQADPDRYVTDDVRSTVVTTWLNSAIDAAVVDVDPSIGTWSKTGSAILPVSDG